MAIVRVQSAAGVLNAGTVTFGSAVTAGNTIIVFFRAGNSATPNNVVADNQGNSYAQAGLATSRGAIHHAFKCVAGTTTITVVTNGAAPSQNVIAAEYSGIDGVNTLHGVLTNTSTAMTSASVTPTAANNLVVCGMSNETSVGVTVSAVTGGFSEASPGSKASHFFDLIQTSATAATCGGTINASVNFTTTIVVYSSGAGSLPCFVQSQGAATGSASYSMPNVKGNLLVVSARFAGTITTPAISDGAGNTWVLAGSKTVGTAQEKMYYVLGCKAAAASNAVTITGAATLEIGIAEYNGLNRIGAVTTGGASSTAYSVGPVTPPVAPNVVISTIANETANTTTYTLTGITAQRASGNGNACIFDHRNVSSTSADTITATISQTVNWGGVIAVFYFAAGVNNSLMMTGCGT